MKTALETQPPVTPEIIAHSKVQFPGPVFQIQKTEQKWVNTSPTNWIRVNLDQS